jgi:hypothetical protein
VLLDSLRETWDRFLKKADDRWPVYVIVTTDGTEGSSATQQQQWDRYLDEILQAGVSTHAVVLQTRMGDLTTQIAMSLTTNTGGQYEAIAATTGLAAKLTDIAARLARDSEALKSWYLVRYESHSKDGDADVGIGVARSNVHLLMSGDRRVD